MLIPALSAGLFKLDARHEGFAIDIKTGNDEIIELLEQRGKDLKEIKTQTNKIDKQIDTNLDKTKEINGQLKLIIQKLDNIKKNMMTKADYEELDRRYK